MKHDAFMQYYYAYVYVRIMQALGAYGFRGFYERKPHFLQSVPYALKNLQWLLDNVELPVALPALMDAFRNMIRSEKLQNLASETENLVIRVFSFSYRRGLPSDESGNGGGLFSMRVRCQIRAAKSDTRISRVVTPRSTSIFSSMKPSTSSWLA